MKIKLLITDEAKWVAYGPCRVVQVFGNNNHTSDNYIQFHEKPLAGLAASDVPAVASIFAPASAPFDWKPVDPICLSELTIAVSSTNVNYTALTNTGVDATVIVETDFPVTTTMTVVGDLTTSVASLQVWSEATGATTKYRLLRVDVVNGSGSEINSVVTAKDTETQYRYPATPLLNVPANSTRSFFFGRDGIHPFELSTAGAEVHGCTVYYSSGVAPFVFNATPNKSFRAIYDI